MDEAAVVGVDSGSIRRWHGRRRGVEFVPVGSALVGTVVRRHALDSAAAPSPVRAGPARPGRSHRVGRPRVGRSVRAVRSDGEARLCGVPPTRTTVAQTRRIGGVRPDPSARATRPAVPHSGARSRQTVGGWPPRRFPRDAQISTEAHRCGTMVPASAGDRLSPHGVGSLATAHLHGCRGRDRGRTLREGPATEGGERALSRDERDRPGRDAAARRASTQRG